MNNFTDLEIELAKKYISGDYTDVQFNYWIIQNNFNKKRMKRLVDMIKTTEPFYVFCKLLLIFMFFHFLFCFLYSVFTVTN
jgi:hypothetical protein